MNNKRYITIFAVIISILLFIISCKKGDAPADEAKMDSYAAEEAVDDAEGDAPEMDLAPNKQMDEKDARKKMTGGKNKEGLIRHFIAPMDFAKTRLLEYKISLSYECENLLKSRQDLLAIISKYGYISHSSATTEASTPYVSAQIYVKSDLLYEALKELAVLGVLQQEDIQAEDHTENMALKERQARREEIRIARRNRALGQAGGRSKNWNDVENALERSENNLDGAEHEKWKIRDRISWAYISINLQGPDKPSEIVVPRYTDALKGLVNIFLGLLYYLLYMSPFIALAILIIVKRDVIFSIFRRRR